jgi:hypothetical protein
MAAGGDPVQPRHKAVVRKAEGELVILFQTRERCGSGGLDALLSTSAAFPIRASTHALVRHYPIDELEGATALSK